MKVLLFGVLALLLVSCGHESQKRETTTEKVVKNVAAGSLLVAAGAPVPIVGTVYHEPSTQIEGRALLSSGGSTFPLPASGVRIVITKGDEVVGRATTENNGSFKFFLRIPDGDYKIRSDSSQYIGQSDVVLKGFKVTDVLLNLSIK